MRCTKEKALQNVRDFYKYSRQLLEFSNGQLKNGMISVVLGRIGANIKKAKSEHIPMTLQMTEEEWMEEMPPVLYPGLFHKEEPKQEDEEPQEEQLELEIPTAQEPTDYTAKLDTIESLLTGLGRILIMQNEKLDKILSVHKEMLAYWQGSSEEQ